MHNWTVCKSNFFTNKKKYHVIFLKILENKKFFENYVHNTVQILKRRILKFLQPIFINMQAL